jgi:DNA helicase-2/ATP-dependent DNA helicase PcrA
MARPLSPQQTAAVQFVTQSKGNLVLEAVAGAGKTTTLIEMSKVAQGNGAFCAFNKSIATEIESKIAPFNLPIKVGTLHSFGFGAIRRAVSRVKVDGNKLRELARREFTGEYETLQSFVISAAAMAKECGIGAVLENNLDNWLDMLNHYNIAETLPNNISEEQGIDAAQYLLNTSNSLTQIVDFSDMIYLPILNRMKIWQYDYILLDEAQDTNASRRALVKMMLKPNGRLIAVGDPFQAIYGFTGADSESMNNIRTEFNAETLPLTVTYRCPKNIVKVANRWVNHIEAHESAPDGLVDACEIGDLTKIAGAQDVIICRNTKPLVELAYKLIRNSVACRVEGRSIGEGLIKLAGRWKTAKNVGELETRLEEWATKEIAKHKERGNDSRCQVVEDQAETLKVFIYQCGDSDSLDILIGKIRELFGDTEAGKQQVLTLSTIHKAKGREWNRVFSLGMNTYSPSKWAKQPWELIQEDNLCYVQVTRAKQHLTMVNVPPKSL